MDNNMNKNLSEKSFTDSVHTYGRIWGIIILVLLVGFPIMLSVLFMALPDFKALGLGLIGVLPTYWATAVVEVFTFVPMLGAGGAYLSFVTGNISNLKLPCSLDAMERADVKPSSEEGEIISTVAIAVSSIVTTVIIILGVILIIPLQPIIESPILKPAFDQLLPALFGGLALAFISKNVKLSIAPIALMLILFITIPALDSSMVGIMVPVGVVFTLIVARILYKKNII